MMTSIDTQIIKQSRLDRLYRGLFSGIIIMIAILIGCLFFQVLALSSQISNQVQSIIDNQAKNRKITDSQNSIVLGYLICIGKVAPDQRTDEIIQNCVKEGSNIDIRNLE